MNSYMLIYCKSSKEANTNRTESMHLKNFWFDTDISPLECLFYEGVSNAESSNLYKLRWADTTTR